MSTATIAPTPFENPHQVRVSVGGKFSSPKTPRNAVEAVQIHGETAMLEPRQPAPLVLKPESGLRRFVRRYIKPRLSPEKKEMSLADALYTVKENLHKPGYIQQIVEEYKRDYMAWYNDSISAGEFCAWTRSPQQEKRLEGEYGPQQVAFLKRVVRDPKIFNKVWHEMLQSITFRNSQPGVNWEGKVVIALMNEAQLWNERNSRKARTKRRDSPEKLPSLKHSIEGIEAALMAAARDKKRLLPIFDHKCWKKKMQVLVDDDLMSFTKKVDQAKAMVNKVTSCMRGARDYIVSHSEFQRRMANLQGPKIDFRKVWRHYQSAIMDLVISGLWGSSPRVISCGEVRCLIEKDLIVQKFKVYLTMFQTKKGTPSQAELEIIVSKEWDNIEEVIGDGDFNPVTVFKAMLAKKA